MPSKSSGITPAGAGIAMAGTNATAAADFASVALAVPLTAQVSTQGRQRQRSEP
jgi:hypothetical protein